MLSPQNERPKPKQSAPESAREGGTGEGVFENRMKRLAATTSVLALGLSLAAAAQPAPAAGTAQAPTSPKVAVISFQAAVTSTNEFQRDFADLQKKFAPQRDQLKSLSDQVDTLTKQLQAQGATLSDTDRAAKAHQIDEKKKQAQRVAEDAQNDYSQEMQDTFGKVAQKVDQVLLAYAKQEGFTMVLDASEQQQQAPLVLYAAPSSDITKAVIDAYNTKSGVPAPPPEAPAAPKPAASK